MGISIRIHIRLILWTICFPWHALGIAASTFECFQSRPDICAPILNITHYEQDHVTPGYLFITPYDMTTCNDGPYIYNHLGELVWYGAVGVEFVHNLHPCHIAGQDKLCMLKMRHGKGVTASGPVVLFDLGLYTPDGERDFTEITIGVEPDMHELNIVNNATAVITTWLDTRPSNLSSVGGPSDGYLRTTGFQEIDIETQAVSFLWDPADHIEIDDSQMELGRKWGDGVSPETGWDYFHINSVDKTQKGDYLISSRHKSTIYMISGQNGTVLWRLGGRRSDFTFESGLNFSSQHHARVHDENEEEGSMQISLFDNASDEWHHSASSSSGLALHLDLKTMHASLVHRYTTPQDIVTTREGSVQFLDSGNVFVYWGGTPFLSEHEHTPDGPRTVFEARLADPTGYWYRTYKANFTTAPTTSPDVYAVAEHASGPTVWYVSWNGATEVQGWRVYASQQQWDEYELVGYFEKRGFETRIERDDFFEWTIIEAVGRNGSVISSSFMALRTFLKDSLQDTGQLVLDA
ncbi:unnamed protein product [Penicillium salamii]|nr:unnamed protein product [Penicillium salamii]CAG8379961.1 unnamed protein product [Penicillium salamii]